MGCPTQLKTSTRYVCYLSLKTWFRINKPCLSKNIWHQNTGFKCGQRLAPITMQKQWASCRENSLPQWCCNLYKINSDNKNENVSIWPRLPDAHITVSVHASSKLRDLKTCYTPRHMWTETSIKFFIVYTVGNHLLLKAICSKGFFVEVFLFLFFFFMSWYHMFSQTKEKNSLKAKAARFILERSSQNPMNHICRVTAATTLSDSHSFIVSVY